MKRVEENERGRIKKRKEKKEGKERGREGENQTVTVEGCRGETWQREKPLISRAWRSFSAT